MFQSMKALIDSLFNLFIRIFLFTFYFFTRKKYTLNTLLKNLLLGTYFVPNTF